MADSNSIFSNFDTMRNASRDLLSLSLIDSRNHLLQRLDRFDGAPQALWLAGQAGWFQEWWIARHVQRQFGRHAEATAVRLASVLAQADAWWRDAVVTGARASAAGGPTLADVKNYLLATLETTLELLEKAGEDDQALYFFRLALVHEDQRNEELLVLGQQIGVNFLKPHIGIALPAPGPVREPLWMAATRWPMGLDAAQGFAMDNQFPLHAVQLPEYEIDAQAVTWQQYVEFVLDGGYDRQELWQPQGWAWLSASAGPAGSDEVRRAPRFVDQIGGATGAVLQNHFGQTMRMLGSQPAMHLSWWEADAWTRWAGRRLPSEAEWEAAAHLGARRGFRWGDVWEWCANNFHAYGAADSNFVAGPWQACSQPHFGSHKVLRGASFATSPRAKSARFRHFALPGQDGRFCGFRSCAV